MTPEDAAAVARLGYRYALVGTSLMQREDAGRAVADLVAAGRTALGGAALGGEGMARA